MSRSGRMRVDPLTLRAKLDQGLKARPERTKLHYEMDESHEMYDSDSIHDHSAPQILHMCLARPASNLPVTTGCLNSQHLLRVYCTVTAVLVSRWWCHRGEQVQEAGAFTASSQPDLLTSRIPLAPRTLHCSVAVAGRTCMEIIIKTIRARNNFSQVEKSIFHFFGFSNGPKQPNPLLHQTSTREKADGVITGGGRVGRYDNGMLNIPLTTCQHEYGCSRAVPLSSRVPRERTDPDSKSAHTTQT